MHNRRLVQCNLLPYFCLLICETRILVIRFLHLFLLNVVVHTCPVEFALLSSAGHRALNHPTELFGRVVLGWAESPYSIARPYQILPLGQSLSIIRRFVIFAGYTLTLDLG